MVLKLPGACSAYNDGVGTSPLRRILVGDFCLRLAPVKDAAWESVRGEAVAIKIKSSYSDYLTQHCPG